MIEPNLNYAFVLGRGAIQVINLAVVTENLTQRVDLDQTVAVLPLDSAVGLVVMYMRSLLRVRFPWQWELCGGWLRENSATSL